MVDFDTFRRNTYTDNDDGHLVYEPPEILDRVSFMETVLPQSEIFYNASFDSILIPTCTHTVLLTRRRVIVSTTTPPT
jgi:hypothetical protein